MPREKLREPHCARLPEWQEEWVQQKAEDMKVSTAEIIRWAVCALIEREKRKSEVPASAKDIAAQFTRALQAIYREAA